MYRFPVPQAARLASFAGVESDLRAVVEYCKRLEAQWRSLGTLDFPLHEALSAAAVIRYGRCFKQGVRQRLLEKHLNAAPSELGHTHRYVIELRDKHVAHSVNPFEENDVTVQISDHYVSSAEVFAVNTAHGRAVGFPSDMPAKLRALGEWWLAWLEVEIKKEKEMLVNLAKTFTLEELKRNGEVLLAADTTPHTVGKRRPRP